MSKLTMQTKGGIPGGFIYPCVGPSSFLGYRLTVRIWFRARATGKRFSFFFKEDGVTWEKTLSDLVDKSIFLLEAFWYKLEGDLPFQIRYTVADKEKTKTRKET